MEGKASEVYGGVGEVIQRRNGASEIQISESEERQTEKTKMKARIMKGQRK